MSDDAIHQPHDKLFKQGFEDPANAAGFLRHHFPAEVSDRIDWDGLSLRPGSFVDSHLRQHESDLLFSTGIEGGEALIYLLFEHQLAEDQRIALRLLRYMVRIWEVYLKENPGVALPPILPVVLAQNEKAWKISPQFSALLDLPPDLGSALAPYLPDFQFELVQLAEMPYEAICGTPAGILLLRVMKAERSDQLLSDPVWDETLLAQVARPVFEMLLRYLLEADIDSEGFRLRVKGITQTDLKDSAMTLAQQLRQEGRQEGRRESLREILLETLAIRFGEVPEGLAEAVRSVSEEDRLRALHLASLSSETLDEFAREL